MEDPVYLIFGEYRKNIPEDKRYFQFDFNMNFVQSGWLR